MPFERKSSNRETRLKPITINLIGMTDAEWRDWIIKALERRRG